MATNNFVPFCNQNTGTNLPTQSAYLADPALPIGNQPGIASSNLNNKALRQSSTIAAVLAQYASDTTGADMLDNQNTADHAIPTALLAALRATLKRHDPITTVYTSSSGNHNLTFKFQIATGSATAAATYSDGTTTYTVKTTVASGTQLDASGGATPAAVAGTLTKLSGTGDATLTYYAYRAPLFLKVTCVGGGGGGGGIATAASSGGGGGGGGAGGAAIKMINSPAATYAYAVGAGGAGGVAGANDGTVGGNTTFSTLTANGGAGGRGFTASTNVMFIGSGAQGLGGTASGGDVNARGGCGGYGLVLGQAAATGGKGGDSIFGGGANPSGTAGTGLSASNYGGGASGGIVISASASAAGGVGSNGIVIVEEHYQ